MLVISGSDHWRPVQTCSFGTPLEQYLVVATETETCIVSKRAVRILLECFLVLIVNEKQILIALICF